RRRDEHPRDGQDRLEHPGDARAWRARHRDRDRRQRGHPAPRRRRHLRAADAELPPGAARRDAAPAARVQDRAAAWAERRSAAEPREDCHRRIAPPCSRYSSGAIYAAMKGFARWHSPSIFTLVALCFLLPFFIVTVSTGCDNPYVSDDLANRAKDSFTGI